ALGQRFLEAGGYIAVRQAAAERRVRTVRRRLDLVQQVLELAGAGGTRRDGHGDENDGQQAAANRDAHDEHLVVDRMVSVPPRQAIGSTLRARLFEQWLMPVGLFRD